MSSDEVIRAIRNNPKMQAKVETDKHFNSIVTLMINDYSAEHILSQILEEFDDIRFECKHSQKEGEA